MAPKTKKDSVKTKRKFQSKGLDDKSRSTYSQQFIAFSQQMQAPDTTQNLRLRRKPSRERRRNRREFERKVLGAWNPRVSYPERQTSVSTGFLSKCQTQVSSGCFQQSVLVQQENIQLPPIHQAYHPQVCHFPGPQVIQQNCCLSQVHTIQTTQVLSQWHHQGQTSHSLLTTGQQYRNWYYSSGNQALQLQQVEQTVQQTQIYCAGAQ